LSENPDPKPPNEPSAETPRSSTAPRRKRQTRKTGNRKSGDRKSGDLGQLIFYIVVNIIVSAATMIGVLLFWEARQPETADGCLPTIAPTTAVSEAPPQPTLAAIPPLEEEVIRIEIIYGAGYLQDERVVLERVGSSDLPIYGWYLEDEEGNRFYFPAVTLKPGATLEVYSRSGESTVLKRFWGASSSVWQIGETARVYDPQGNLRAEFMIP
jgi:hypothetical protein